jgi:hypothetical protein
MKLAAINVRIAGSIDTIRGTVTPDVPPLNATTVRRRRITQQRLTR